VRTTSRAATPVALSLPTIVGREGAEQVLEPAMDAAERERLEHSADVLRRAAEQLVLA
jgi:malate/lactate dehydrogenase